MYTPILQFSFSCFELLEQHSNRVRYDPRAHFAYFVQHAHGVRFPSSSLPVDEVSRVVAFKYVIYEWLGWHLEYFFLCRFLVKYEAVVKITQRLPWILERDACRLRYRDTVEEAINMSELLSESGSHSHVHFERFGLFLRLLRALRGVWNQPRTRRIFRNVRRKRIRSSHWIYSNIILCVSLKYQTAAAELEAISHSTSPSLRLAKSPEFPAGLVALWMNPWSLF